MAGSAGTVDSIVFAGSTGTGVFVGSVDSVDATEGAGSVDSVDAKGSEGTVNLVDATTPLPPAEGGPFGRGVSGDNGELMPWSSPLLLSCFSANIGGTRMRNCTCSLSLDCMAAIFAFAASFLSVITLEMESRSTARKPTTV